MFSKLIFWISIAATLVITVSFALFTLDEASNVSSSVTIATPDNPNPVVGPVPRDEQGRRVGEANQTRHQIDKVADAITSPVRDLYQSQDPWMLRGLSFLIGLAFWGLLLQWVSRRLSM